MSAAALAMPGVHAALTHADVPGEKRYGLEFSDQPVLALDRVRYFGEPVAIVAAEEPEQARRAAAAVRVEYELLDPVVDAERATEMEPLHPDRPTMGIEHGYRDDPRPNVVRSLVIRRGDPDAAGDVVVTGVYELAQQDQAFLGPGVGHRGSRRRGGRRHPRCDAVAPRRPRPGRAVPRPRAGAGPDPSGGRGRGVRRARGPVDADPRGNARVAHEPPREDGLRPRGVVRRPRSPAPRADLGRAPRDAAPGSSSRCGCDILLDGGAYASSSTAVISNACAFAVGPYAVDNVLVEGLAVYTNNPPCGAMSGFGAVQACFAAESQMDKLAAALDIDPVELRLLNALEPGGTLATGQVITGSLPTKEVIRRAAALEAPEQEDLPREAIKLPGGAGNTTRGEGVRRGIGFALGFKNICYSEGFDDFCTARVRISAGGRAEVHCAAAEVGQGVSEVILEVARRELGSDDVALADGTTADVGSAGSTSASRMTWMAAGAVQLACRAALEERERSGGGEVDVERVYRHPRTFPLDPETGQTMGDRSHVAFAVAAMRVVVEVDVDLGLTRVVWIGTAQDVGTALSRTAVEGQIEGGTAQGLGLALMEEIQTRDGAITNASFTDYLIPTFLDMPPVVSDLVEVPDPDAPYGVKGVGEPPTVVSTAAIVSALRDATGRELARVPVRPDDILGL